MKLLPAHLILILSNSAFAQHPVVATGAHELTDAIAQAHLMDDYAICLRDRIESVTGDKNNFIFFLNDFNRVFNEIKTDVKSLTAEIKACKDEKGFFASASGKFKRVEQNKYADQFKSLMSPKTYAFLKTILYPHVTCSKVSAKLALALVIVGGNAKFEIAKCTSSTGRRWFEARVGAGSSDDLGVTVDFSATHDQRDNVNVRAPVAKNTYSKEGAMAVGAGLSDQDTGNNGKHTISGFTVGMGYTENSGSTANLQFPGLSEDKTIPGNNLAKILNQ